GTFSGSVKVTSGALRVQNDTALGVGLKPNPTGSADVVPGTTTLLAGTNLELAGAVPTGNGGAGGGIQLGGNFVLSSPGLNEVQRVTVTGAKGTFRLTYN